MCFVVKKGKIDNLQKLRAGFRIDSLALRNAGSPAEVFFSAAGTQLNASGEARIRKTILACDEVTREIVFSSNEAIRNLRIEQEMRLNNTLIEKHNFRFGFVIPHSTNTWEQTYTAADNGRFVDPEVLSGNLEILTTFCDGNRLIKRLSLIVYYV